MTTLFPKCGHGIELLSKASMGCNQRKAHLREPMSLSSPKLAKPDLVSSLHFSNDQETQELHECLAQKVDDVYNILV